MFEPNVAVVLSQLSPTDVVVDIGGWACPFNRANYVLDAEPYETRGFYRTFGGPPSQGPTAESFSKATWITRDLCAREPYPFADKSIDFVICSHTLEDLRDPVWVCSEMVRIAKRGYLEVPSHVAEVSRGWEHPRLAGLSHHRWLIDIADGIVTFRMKPHRLHSHWRFSFPKSFLEQLRPDERVQWLFWNDRFDCCETAAPHHSEHLEAELEAYVSRRRPYAPWRLMWDRRWRAGRARVTRLAMGARRRVLGDESSS